MLRRLILCALVALAWAAPSPAGPPTPDTLVGVMKAKGRPELSIIEAGANPADPASVATALQTAIDAMARPDIPPGDNRVTIPAGSWQTDRPVFTDVDGVALTGPGTLTPAVGRSHPILIAFRRVPKGGKALTADHYPDATGKLDSTAGARRGLRLLNDSTLTAWSSPLNLGPPLGWPDAKGLTIDVVLDTDAGPLDKISILGIARRGTPSPFILLGRGGKLSLLYSLAGESAFRSLSIPLPPKGGVKRFAFQLDFAKGRGLVLVNGVQVAAAGESFPPGSKLIENEGLPFRIGSSGQQSTDYLPDNWGGMGDLCLYGLHISRSPRYAPPDPGAIARRLDGKAVTDRQTYFTPDSDTLGLLTLDDDPATAAATRSASFVTGVDSYGPRSVMLFIDKLHQSEFNSIPGLSFTGLNLAGRGRYGALLTLGQTLDCKIDHLTGLGGANAIGTFCATTNYTVDLGDSTLWGTDAAIHLYFGIADLRRLRFPFAGRCGVLRLDQVTAELDTAFIERPGAGATPRRLALAYDSSLFATKIRNDMETPSVPTEAVFDAIGSAGGMTRLPFLGIERFSGDLPANVPLARLRSVGNNPRPGACRIVDPAVGGSGPIADSDGSWGVVLDCPTAPTVGAPIDRSQGKGPQSIRCRWLDYPGPLQPSPTGPPSPLPPPAGQGPAAPATATP